MGAALLCFSLAAYTVQALILKLFETFGRLHLQLRCWLFSLWFSSMYPSNYALLRFSRAYYFVQSQSWKSSTLRGICPAKLSFKLITTLPMEVSYRQSAALLFAGLLYCSSLNVETLWEFRNTTRANVKLNFSLLFSMMSPINNVLLWFARASYIVQVSVMKVFKCSVDYSLQNFVSNHSLLFWWNSPLCAALLSFSLASYIVQVSMLKLFQSFGRLHWQVLCWNFFLWVLPFLVQVSVMKMFKSSIECAQQNSVSNHSRLFWWKSPISAALLCFSLAYYFVQSQSWKSSTLRGIFPAKLSFKLITTLPMEVSYWQSAALLFAGLLYCSSLNVETLREFRKTTRANVKLNFSLWFSMMSPINNVLLWFALASYIVQVSVMKVFKCSVDYSLQNFVSNHSLLFWWSSPISAALLCFWLAACIVQASILELFEGFGRIHLQLWFWSFSLWFSLMHPSNNALLRFSLAYCFVHSQSWKSSTLRAICPAKLRFKLISTVPMEVSYRQSAALLFAGLLYCSSLNFETLRDFQKPTSANVKLNFSLWFSMMSPINNVLLWFARASYIVQVSVMKVFNCSVDYSLQNFVSNHSLLFWWKSPISAALLCFSLASYIVQVSILKLFESFGRLHFKFDAELFLCGS